MALENMRETMFAALCRRGASKKIIDDYDAHWRAAENAPGSPLPCPVCFSAGTKDSRLIPLPASGDMQRVKCYECGERFEFADSD